MEDNKIQSYEFVGWIEKMSGVNRYGRDIYVRTLKDATGEKFPQKAMFSISTKNLDKVDDNTHCPGAKVKVKFIPFLSEGVSKMHKAYSINKLMLQSIELLEAAPIDEATGRPVEEDMPF